MKTFDPHRSVSPGISRRRHRAGTSRAVICTTLIAGLLAACTEPADLVPIATISFNKQADSVLLGKTYQLAVTMRDANANVVSGRRVVFASEQPTVAEPDANGLVTTKLGDQVAIMKATVEGKIATMPLKVLLPATKIVVAPASNDVSMGTTRALAATLTAANGAALSGRTVSWKSSNLSVAVVSPGGVVTAVAVGEATITATGDIDGVEGTATFNVTDPITLVRLTPAAPQTLRIGGTLQMTATPLNSAGQPVTGRTVEWSVPASQSVITVSPTGLVTAVGLGTSTVTADVEGRTATLGITVTKIPAKTITLSPSAFTLADGTSRQLIPVVVDSAGNTETTLADFLDRVGTKWSTSNATVASVNPATAIVTATANGTAVISVTADGVKSNDVTVTVASVVNSIRLAPFQPQLLRVGGTLQVTATPLDNASQPVPGKTVNWTVGNPSVLSVSNTGLVTAVGVGSTVVTAEVDGKTTNLNVTVTLVPIKSVTLVPAIDTMIVGDQRQYIPVVRDTADRIVANLNGRNVSWQSSNLLIANVTSQGVATGAAAGVTDLTLSVDGVSGNALRLNVVQVGSVTVTPNPGGVKIGQGLQLTVVVKGATGQVLTITRQSLISFSSSAPAIASVSPFGLVNGLTAGSVVISANVNGVVGQATVNVTP